METTGTFDAATGGDEAFLGIFGSGRKRQLHQRRQKSRECLAGTGRRDQERGAVLARLLQQRQLMLARRPAAAGEPFLETVRQQRGRLGGRVEEIEERHGITAKLSGASRRGWAKPVWCEWKPEFLPRPACGERSDRLSDPGEGVTASPSVTALAESAPH